MKNYIIGMAVATVLALSCMAGEPPNKPENGIVVSGELRALALMKVESVIVFPRKGLTLEELFKDLGGFTEWSFRFTIMKKDGTRVFFRMPKFNKDVDTRIMQLDGVKSVDVAMEKD
jgi:hypothetical protein